MSKVGKWDEVLFGLGAGVLIAYPSVATSINNFFDSIIPSSWNWFGSWTNPLIIIASLGLIGLIVSKTK
jgi:hypothetical protein